MPYTRQELAVYERIHTQVAGRRLFVAAVVGVVTVVAKLVGALDVSWWWGTVPLWGGALYFVGVCLHLTLLRMNNEPSQVRRG